MVREEHLQHISLIGSLGFKHYPFHSVSQLSFIFLPRTVLFSTLHSTLASSSSSHSPLLVPSPELGKKWGGSRRDEGMWVSVRQSSMRSFNIRDWLDVMEMVFSLPNDQIKSITIFLYRHRLTHSISCSSTSSLEPASQSVSWAHSRDESDMNPKTVSQFNGSQKN